MISKKESNILKGIATLLLIWHHLFNGKAVFITYTSALPSLIQNIAWFGRICVGIFAFVSGYGFYIKYSKIPSTNLAQVKQKIVVSIKTYIKFVSLILIPLIIFEPVYLYISKESLTIKQWVMALIGWGSVSFGEWWYIRKYITIIFFICFFDIIISIFKSNKHQKICVVLIGLWLLGLSIIHYNTFSNILIAYEGYIVAKYNCFSILFQKIRFLNRFCIVLAIFLITTCGIWRVGIMNGPADSFNDIYIVPIFIFAIHIIYVTICKNFNNTDKKSFLEYNGIHCMYLWLIHPVLLYYMCPNLFNMLRFSIFMFIGLYLTTLCLTLLFEKLYKVIYSFIKYLFSFLQKSDVNVQ